jgi:hypothetical protein
METAELLRIVRHNKVSSATLCYYKESESINPFLDMFHIRRDLFFVSPSSLATSQVVFGIGGYSSNLLRPARYGVRSVDPSLDRLSVPDREEAVIKLLRDPVIKNNLKVGFGWGAHLLAVYNGAKIIQSLDGHDEPHPVMVDGIGVITCRVPHTQAMTPYTLLPEKYQVLAYSFCGKNRVLAPGSTLNTSIDFEILYFPETRSLCVEGYFGYIGPADNYIVAIRQIIMNLLHNPNYYGVS